MIKLHNCVFFDNVYILKSELINDEVMNKVVLNTWTHSMLRELGELQYSHVRARQGCVQLLLPLPFPILYASLFYRRYTQIAGLDRTVETFHQNPVTYWGSSLQISLDVLLRFLTHN